MARVYYGLVVSSRATVESCPSCTGVSSDAGSGHDNESVLIR